MIRHLRLRTRLITPLLAAALGLIVGLTPTPSLGQNEPPPGEEKSEGRTLDGYMAAGVLAGLALFVVAKSARRL